MSNVYDRIFKENASSILEHLVFKRLGIKNAKWTPLEPKFQKTIERENDHLVMVEPEDQQPFVLHIEYQSHHDKNMLARFAEYHGLIYRKYQLEVKHFLVYVGEQKLRMENELVDSHIFRGYEIIALNELDPNELLTTQVPEQIILTILTNFPKAEANEILLRIFKGLMMVCTSPKELSRYIKQLSLIGKLRNLDATISEKLKSMPVTVDHTTHIWYKEGRKEGRQEGHEEGHKEGRKEGINLGEDKMSRYIIVRGLQQGLSVETLSQLTGLSTKQIQKILSETKS